MDNITLSLMTGADIPLPEYQITLHQPTLKEISMIGEQNFFIAAQCLTINKSMYIKDESLLENTNNFQIFMTIMNEKEAADKKASVRSLLTLLFPSSNNIMFTPRGILISTDKSDIVIDENNFEGLQPIFQRIFCLENQSEQSFNPGNKAAQAIAEKLMRARQKVAAQKQAEGGPGGSIFTQYLSLLAIGLHQSLLDLTKLTMFQLYDQVERYQLYIQWDLDARTRLAGGKPDHEPENWMKNIH